MWELVFQCSISSPEIGPDWLQMWQLRDIVTPNVHTCSLSGWDPNCGSQQGCQARFQSESYLIFFNLMKQNSIKYFENKNTFLKIFFLLSLQIQCIISFCLALYIHSIKKKIGTFQVVLSFQSKFALLMGVTVMESQNKEIRLIWQTEQAGIFFSNYKQLCIKQKLLEKNVPNFVVRFLC